MPGYFFVNLIVCFFWPVSTAATYVPEGNEEVSTALFPLCILHEYTKSPERLKMLRLASEPPRLLSKLTLIMQDVSSYDKVFMLVLLSVLCVLLVYSFRSVSIHGCACAANAVAGGIIAECDGALG